MSFGVGVRFGDCLAAVMRSTVCSSKFMWLLSLSAGVCGEECKATSGLVLLDTSDNSGLCGSSLSH